MRHSLMQIRGMIYYETLMHWRRGWLRLVGLTIIVTPLLMAILARVLFPPSFALEKASPEALAVVTMYITSLLTAATLPGILMVLPIMAAEIVPLDQKYRVRGLIDSLPLKTSVYLAGKLLGAWSALIVFAMGVFMVGLGARIILGTYDLIIWIHLWSVGLLPFAFFTSGISLLIAANRASRRSATLIGSTLSIPCTMAFLTSPFALFYVWISSQLVNRQDWTNFLAELPPFHTPTSTLMGLLVLVVAWTIGWSSLHRQQIRA